MQLLASKIVLTVLLSCSLAQCHTFSSQPTRDIYGRQRLQRLEIPKVPIIPAQHWEKNYSLFSFLSFFGFFPLSILQNLMLLAFYYALKTSPITQSMLYKGLAIAVYKHMIYQLQLRWSYLVQYNLKSTTECFLNEVMRYSGQYSPWLHNEGLSRFWADCR